MFGFQSFSTILNEISSIFRFPPKHVRKRHYKFQSHPPKFQEPIHIPKFIPIEPKRVEDFTHIIRIQKIIRGFLGRIRAKLHRKYAFLKAKQFWEKLQNLKEDEITRKLKEKEMKRKFARDYVQDLIWVSQTFLVETDASIKIQRVWRGHWARRTHPYPLKYIVIVQKRTVKCKFDAETLRRIWARSIFVPEGRWVPGRSDKDLIYKDQHLPNLVNPPLDPRTFKLPPTLNLNLSSLSSDQTLRQLLYDRRVWAGFPVSFEEVKEKERRDRAELRTRVQRERGRTVVSRLLGPSPYRSLTATSSLATLAELAKTEKQNKSKTKSSIFPPPSPDPPPSTLSDIALALTESQPSLPPKILATSAQELRRKIAALESTQSFRSVPDSLLSQSSYRPLNPPLRVNLPAHPRSLILKRFDFPKRRSNSSSSSLDPGPSAWSRLKESAEMEVSSLIEEKERELEEASRGFTLATQQPLRQSNPLTTTKRNRFRHRRSLLPHPHYRFIRQWLPQPLVSRAVQSSLSTPSYDPSPDPRPLPPPSLSLTQSEPLVTSVSLPSSATLQDLQSLLSQAQTQTQPSTLSSGESGNTLPSLPPPPSSRPPPSSSVDRIRASLRKERERGGRARVHVDARLLEREGVIEEEEPPTPLILRPAPPALPPPSIYSLSPSNSLHSFPSPSSSFSEYQPRPPPPSLPSPSDLPLPSSSPSPFNSLDFSSHSSTLLPRPSPPPLPPSPTSQPAPLPSKVKPRPRPPPPPTNTSEKKKGKNPSSETDLQKALKKEKKIGPSRGISVRNIKISQTISPAQDTNRKDLHPYNWS